MLGVTSSEDHAMPKIECPHCAARHDAPAEFAGRKARCNKCGKPFGIHFDFNAAADTFEVAEAEPVFDELRESRPQAPSPVWPVRAAGSLQGPALQFPSAQAQPIDAFGLAALGIAVALILFVPTIAVPAGSAVCLPFLAIGIGRAVDRRRLHEIIVTALTVVLLGISVVICQREQAKAAEEASQPAKKIQESLDSFRGLILPSSPSRHGL
jgi:hypothetical protein